MNALKNQSGQALLIVLLSMAVVLTIVLSVLSRSVTNIAITSRGEESIRAFSAAEAGVEQALVGATRVGEFEGATYDAQVADVGQGLVSFGYPLEIASGDTATIWFVNHNDDGALVCDASHPCFTGTQIQVCWGEYLSYTDPNLRPAVEVSIFYYNTPGNPGTARIARATFDSNSSRTSTNRFDPATTSGCTVENKSYPFSATMNFASLGIPGGILNTANALQFATIRMLYNSDQTHPFGVNAFGASRFPSQGKRINSTGKSGEAIRKVEVFRLFSDLPTPFQSAVFAPNGVTK